MSLLKPSKIIGVGRNYVAHARELGNEVPTEPLIFLKPSSALIEHGQPIVLPSASARVEYESEIGIVITHRIRGISADEAATLSYGVTCVNDVTARDLQKKDSQWARAKGFDSFCPAGPRVVEGLDWRKLEVIGRVNGQERQRGSSDLMVFPIPVLIAYISAIMTLEVGDLIATGTPAGTAPLSVGDVVEVEIPGVGILSNPVKAA
ncbi:MAG: fumarylacetoacetate hydrolase family protein [Gemmatimonadota bacterium]